MCTCTCIITYNGYTLYNLHKMNFFGQTLLSEKKLSYLPLSVRWQNILDYWPFIDANIRSPCISSLYERQMNIYSSFNNFRAAYVKL